MQEYVSILIIHDFPEYLLKYIDTEVLLERIFLRISITMMGFEEIVKSGALKWPKGRKISSGAEI